MRTRLAVVGAVAVSLLLIAVAVRDRAPVAIASSGTDIVTYHADSARTGQNLTETTLTPSNVSAATFGKVGFFPVDGLVDAQPLYLSNLVIPGRGTHNVVYAATEHDSVYAFDGDSGALLWQVSALGAGETPSDDRGCDQVNPEIGITSTPVIDRARGAIYLIAMSKNQSHGYFQRIHALDITTGAEMFGGPMTIQATYPGTGAGSAGGTVIFDPGQYKERSALLEIGSTIHTVWASHCDIPPYTGWMMSFDSATLAQTSVLDVTPNGSDGAMWNAGGGPAADASGNFYVLNGNGTFDAMLTSGGFPTQGDYGNGFLKIATAGGLSVADYFEMWDTVPESNVDMDLGSGAAIVLPDLFDNSGMLKRLTVGAGKDMRIYLANRDSMGKWNGMTDQIYQEVIGALAGIVISTPAYFNNTVYFGAAGDTIRGFSIANARLSTSATSQTTHAFPYPGSTPAISANGTTNGILWAIENAGSAVLHAYNPANLAQEYYASTQAPGGRDAFGAGNKFMTPTIANGHVYVGTPNGVAAFGLLTPAPPPAGTPTPAAGATRVSPAVTLSWMPTGANSYDVMFGTMNPPPLVLSGLTTSSYAPIGLAAGTTYFWQVVGRTSGGATAGPVWSFTTRVGGTGPLPTMPARFEPSTGGGDAWLYNASSGAWAEEVNNGGFSQAHTGTWATGWTLNTGDFNGDGLTDLFFYNSTNGAWYMGISQGGGQFTFYNGIWRAGFNVTVLDMNGDGRSDVFVYDPTDGVWVQCITVTPGTFSFVQGQWHAGWQIYPADFNGDGLADLFLYDPVAGLWYEVISQRDGTFAYVNGVWAAGWTVRVGDFDGDGRSDVFLYDSIGGTWYVALTTGAGFTYQTGRWAAGWDVSVGDFNGDGRADLFLYNASGTWYEVFAGASGSFAYATGTWAPGWKVSITDFNGDGLSDVLLYNPTSGVWYQAITTMAQGQFTYRSGNWGPGWTVLASQP